jgi:hypothetical protein
MNARRSLLIRILVSIELVSAFTSQASAGYFPSRPKGVALRHFTGVIGDDYGIGNGIGGFTLIIGTNPVWFYIGWPMEMNGKIVECHHPELNDQPGNDCVDWFTELVLGKSVVTTTCWSDRRFNRGRSTLFCDEIDTRSYWIEHHKKHKAR